MSAPEAQTGDVVGRLRRDVVALTRIPRPSASDGERRSAEWIRAQLAEAALDSRVEAERATGGYWVPLGLLSAVGLVAGVAGLRGRRRVAALAGALAAAGVWDDLDMRRRLVRAALARRTTYNVVCELGPPDARRTVVVVAHHDAAHAGLVFHPGPGAWLARNAPQVLERAEEDPPLWHPVIGGPALTAAGALLGSRRLLGLGTALSALALLVLTDIAARDAVPGAIDNASGVAAVLELGRRLAREQPSHVRVMLLFTGSEEALWEGMDGFARRHFGKLPVDDTFVLNVDQVGDPFLSVLRGEGALKVHDYRLDGLAVMHEVAEAVGVPLVGGLRSRTGTDAQRALRAGYPAAVLSSVTANKLQTAYHWPTDTPDVVDWGSVASAVAVSERLVRRLDERWLHAGERG